MLNEYLALMVACMVELKYRAFLSYSHRDKAWGKWLHGALEGYRIGKDLVGRNTHVGPVPKTLRPIFRDREDFSAGHSLTEQTIAALEASQFLIVLCSPNSAQSPYVNEEVSRFKAMGRGERVIALIVGGEPGHPERECFPAAVRFAVGREGGLTDEREEPIAADARPEGDGKEIAKLKVVAGVLGLGLDEIVRREHRARQRRNTFWASLAGVFLLLMVLASSSAVYAYKKLVESEERLDQAVELAYGFVAEATTMSDRAGVPIELNLRLLRRAETALNHLMAQGADTHKLRHRRALMLLSFADTFRRLGRLDDWRTRADEARSLLIFIADGAASNVGLQRDLAAVLDSFGDAALALGRNEEAIASYRTSLPIRERIAASDAPNLRWRRELWLTCDKLTDLLWEGGDHSQSVNVASASLARLIAMIKTIPDSEHLQSNVEQRIRIAHASWLGATASLRAFGPSSRIPIYRRYSFALLVSSGSLEDFDKQTPDESHALLFETVGESSTRNDPKHAADAYARAIDTWQKLTQTDPMNGSWQRDLSRVHDKMGDVLLKLGKASEAKDSYRAALAIRERFAAADPSHVPWQLELVQSHWRLASTGDDPTRRWEIVVATLRKMASETKLTVEQAKRLPVAEAELAISQHPTSAAAYNRRGLIHRAKRDYVRAIEDFTKAIELDGVFADAYKNRASAHKASNEYDPDNNRSLYNDRSLCARAISDLTKAIEINSGDVEAYKARGDCHADDYDRRDSSIADYTKAIELAPRDAAAYSKRGHVFASKSDDLQAVFDFSKVIELEPNNTDAYMARGASFSSDQNHHNAIKDFSKAIEINASMVSAYDSRGKEYARVGEHDLAIADFTRVIESRPKDSWVHIRRGTSYGAKQDHPRAVADFTKAITLHSGSAEPFHLRAWQHFKLGNSALGLPDAERALSLEPNNANALEIRGHILEALDRKDDAIADFRKALSLNGSLRDSLEGLKRLIATGQTAVASLTAAPPKPHPGSDRFAIAHKVSRLIKDDGRRVAALATLAEGQAKAGLTAEALVTLEEATGAAHSIKKKDERSSAHSVMSRAYLKLGRLEEAFRAAQEIEPISWRLNIVAGIAEAQAKLGLGAEAKTTLEQALEAALSISDESNRASLVALIASKQASAGWKTQALGTLEKALELVALIPDHRRRGWSLGGIAEVQIKAGLTAEAGSTLANALPIALAVSEKDRPFDLSLIADRQARAGLTSDAIATFSHAVRSALMIKGPFEFSSGVTSVADSWIRAGLRPDGTTFEPLAQMSKAILHQMTRAFGLIDKIEADLAGQRRGDAVVGFRQLAALAQSLPDPIEALGILGVAQASVGLAKDAVETFELAERIARAMADGSLIALASIASHKAQACTLWGASTSPCSTPHLRDALRTLRISWTNGIVRLTAIARTQVKVGLATEGGATFEDALNAAKLVADEQWREVQLRNITEHLAEGGFVAKGLQIALTIQDTNYRWEALAAIAKAQLKAGLLSDVPHTLDYALAAARSLPNLESCAWSLAEIATAHAEIGSKEQAVTILAETMQIAQFVMTSSAQLRLLARVAEGQAMGGLVQEAAETIERVVGAADLDLEWTLQRMVTALIK